MAKFCFVGMLLVLIGPSPRDSAEQLPGILRPIARHDVQSVQAVCQRNFSSTSSPAHWRRHRKQLFMGNLDQRGEVTRNKLCLTSTSPTVLKYLKDHRQAYD